MAILSFLGSCSGPLSSNEPVSRWLGLKSSFLWPLSSPEAPSSTAASTLAPTSVNHSYTCTGSTGSSHSPHPQAAPLAEWSVHLARAQKISASQSWVPLTDSYQPPVLWQACLRLPVQHRVSPPRGQQAVNLHSLPLLQRSSHLLSQDHGSLLACGAQMLQLGYGLGVGIHTREKSAPPASQRAETKGCEIQKGEPCRLTPKSNSGFAARN